MNAFRKMQERLREEGWYVGWNEPCCQSCAWGSLPDYLDAKYDDDGYLIRKHPETGKELSYSEMSEVFTELDLSKVLFNHSQDCEFDLYDHVAEYFDENLDQADEFFEEYESARDAVEDGETDAVNKLFEKYNISHLLTELVDMDQSVSGFVCYTPEQQNSSYFCFDGSKKGVANFKEIVPIIEECGVTVDHFDESGKSRIELSW